MQEIKNLLKNLGKHFQTTKSSHRETLRAKLAGQQGESTPVRVRPFSWMSLVSFGIAGVAVFAIVVKFTEPRFTTLSNPEYEEYSYSVTELDATADATGLLVTDSFWGANSDEVSDVGDEMSIRTPVVQSIKSNTGEIIDYENNNGTMLEEHVTVSLLTKEDDAVETVSALFASLGGHLSSIRDNDDSATISGSISAERLSFFYDQLDDLVKNDDYLEKNIRGESIVAQAVDVAERLQVLRDSETEITKQLQIATTDEQKKMLQESLETTSNEIDELTQEQRALEDRVDYVEVTVSVKKLPSLWEVQGEYDLREVIAGYEAPNLWQRIVMNVLTVFLVTLEVLSATFWILIPLAIFMGMRLKRRRMLRELD